MRPRSGCAIITVVPPNWPIDRATTPAACVVGVTGSLRGGTPTWTSEDPAAVRVAGVSPAVLTAGARLRINAPIASGTTFDEWFVDDVVIGCDLDGDNRPNYAEDKLPGTDPQLVDTDGDGVEDGAEIVAGTDPLVFN